MSEKAVATSIVLVDDHTIVLDGLRALISAQSDMVVVGEAENAADAIRVAASCKPDVVVLDLTIPGGGLQAIQPLLKASPRSKILVLTMHEDEAYARTVFATGGSGYLVKRAAHTELLNAIRKLCAGKRYVHHSIAEALLINDSPSENVAVLTDRESEALKLLASGYTYQEISARLGISVKTVESYRSRILLKLNLRTRSELVRFAVSTGLIAD